MTNKEKKRKHDVTDNDNDGDVKNESVGEKRDVITEEKDAEKHDEKGRKKRKLDVTDKDNGGDVTNGSEQEDK